MKLQDAKTLLLPALVLLAGQPLLQAQNFSIRWSTIDGGGGALSGGGYALRGTIGQPDAGRPMTNGLYAVTGGFWVSPSPGDGAPTPNLAPLAPNQNFIRAQGLALEIRIADLLAACSDPDGGIPVLSGLGASVAGAQISTTATHILYALPGSDANDSFSYTIGDGQGGTALGTITVLVAHPGGLVRGISLGGGAVTVNFTAIPGLQYDIQRAVFVIGPWTTLDTRIARTNGSFEFTDPNPPIPSAYYRLKRP